MREECVFDQLLKSSKWKVPFRKQEIDFLGNQIQ